MDGGRYARALVLLSLGLAAVFAIALHFLYSSVGAVPQMKCVGWTVYLNGLTGIPITQPEFEANALGLLDDPPSARFLTAAAARVRMEFRSELSGGEVYVVPFQAHGLSAGGWPFASRRPFSTILVARGEAREIVELHVSADGGSPFSAAGLIANYLFFLPFCGLFVWLAHRSWQSAVRYSIARRRGFPVDVVGRDDTAA